MTQPSIPDPVQRSFPGGVTLGSIGGVVIVLDWSLIIIFLLITFNLAAGVFPSWHPAWSPATTWLTALGAAVLFLASILAHELSHAVVARAQGIPINRISLFLFGGMAHMEREPATPGAEFRMAVIGPIVSIAIGFLAIFLGMWLAGPTGFSALALPVDPVQVRAEFANIGPIATLLLWLGPVNLLLGAFNLIPGFPLDGGRVLRSIIWAITDDLTKATRWASAAGRVFALVLMALGVMNMFGGAFVQGIWLILIGWFLGNAARMSYVQLLVRQTLADVPVSRVMRTDLERVAPDMPLESFVREHLMVSDQQAFPVESGGRLVGLVAFEDVRRIPHADWTVRRVEDVMTPASELHALPPNAAADRALEELARHASDQIPVVDGLKLLGIVRRGDLLRWISLQNGLARPV